MYQAHVQLIAANLPGRLGPQTIAQRTQFFCCKPHCASICMLSQVESLLQSAVCSLGRTIGYRSLVYFSAINKLLFFKSRLIFIFVTTFTYIIDDLILLMTHKN